MTLETDINIGSITEALNGKIDLDAGNIANTGKSVIAHDAMPSSTYDNLTWGASGTTYTMPADGWLAFFGQNTSSGSCYCVFVNSTNGFRLQAQLTSSYGSPNLYFPVNKNDEIAVFYANVGVDTSTDYQWFRFYYANGSSWEAS